MNLRIFCVSLISVVSATFMQAVADSSDNDYSDSPNSNVRYALSQVTKGVSGYSETVSGVISCIKGTFNKEVWLGVSTYYTDPMRVLSSSQIELCGNRWGMALSMKSGDSNMVQFAGSFSFMTLGRKYLIGLYTLENGMYYPIPMPGEYTAVNGVFTGVEEIEADNDKPVEWYDLSGNRVESPSKGLFIKRQGRVMEKVLVQ